MKIPEQIRDGLNVVLNEAALLNIILNENENFLIVGFELLRKGTSEKSNYVHFKFENIKRYIAAYRAEIDNVNDIIKFEPHQINDYLNRFVNKDIYGWEFFNVEKSNLDFSKLSFEYLKSDDYDMFNSLELFQDGLKEDLDIKIWFESVKIFDENNVEIIVKELISRQQEIWESIFKK